MRGPNSHARRRHTLLSTLSTVFASWPIRCCHPAHRAATAVLTSARTRPCPELLACSVPPKSFSWEKSGEKIARRCAKFGSLAPGRVSPRRRPVSYTHLRAHETRGNLVVLEQLGTIAPSPAASVGAKHGLGRGPRISRISERFSRQIFPRRTIWAARGMRAAQGRGVRVRFSAQL